jgi:hypothetical protein
MARVNILLFVNQLANVVMDFVAQDLSTSGLVMSAFFCGHFGAYLLEPCSSLHKP